MKGPTTRAPAGLGPVVGERITAARQMRLLSCRDLAARLGIPTREMLLLEADETAQPTREQMQQIVFATGFPPAYFRKPMGPRFDERSVFFCKIHDTGESAVPESAEEAP